MRQFKISPAIKVAPGEYAQFDTYALAEAHALHKFGPRSRPVVVWSLYSVDEPGFMSWLSDHDMQHEALAHLPRSTRDGLVRILGDTITITYT